MVSYNVTGMNCAACQARVEKAVSRVSGVTSCSVSLLTNSMSVEGDVNTDEIINAVKDAGYGASLKGTSDAPDKSVSVFDVQKEEIKTLKRRLIASLVFLVSLMYISMGHNMLGMAVPDFLKGNYLALTLTQMLIATIVMVINKSFFINGFKSVMHLSPNMDTLVALGSSVSFGWSVFVFYQMCTMITTGAANNELMELYMNKLYFESAAMIPALITVGKLLEAVSKGKTTDALSSLTKLAPNSAFVMRGDKEVRIPIEELKVGDEFIVKPGRIIPVDGVVVEGSASVNESALTGESVPVKKGIDDTVCAATVNMEGNITCRATHIGDDTTLSKIIKMVEEAAQTKAPISRVADKAAAVFVPVVILIAIGVIVGWLIAGKEASFAIARGIAVLVISCPCSLGLATPVAVMVGNGIGAKKGILFKTGEALELTGRIKNVILDKTGTITKGDLGSDGKVHEDEIREDSAEAISALKKMGLAITMLSGDKQSRAKEIADKVGIDNVVAEVKPGGKEDAVEDAQVFGLTAMVGDGINDAVALTRADVGMAIGAGTDVAIDSADVVLMNSSINDVVKAVKISKKTLKNIRENLFWSFFYNIICIPLAAGLLFIELNPMIAAAAMSLSSFSVCMNALRLNLLKRKL